MSIDYARIKNCVYDPTTTTIYDQIDPDTGKTIFGEKPAAEYAAEKNAEVWDFDEAIAHKMNTYKHGPRPITHARFHELLNVLPPEDWHTRGEMECFKLIERTYANITVICIRHGHRYYMMQDSFLMKHDDIFGRCVAGRSYSDGKSGGDVVYIGDVVRNIESGYTGVVVEVDHENQCGDDRYMMKVAEDQRWPDEYAWFDPFDVSVINTTCPGVVRIYPNQFVGFVGEGCIFKPEADDLECITEKVQEFNRRSFPAQGDYIRRKDGTVLRIAHVHERNDDRVVVQPATSGSYSISKGYCSHSGGLALPETLELEREFSWRPGHAWAWGHRGSGASMGINFSTPFRQYEERR